MVMNRIALYHIETLLWIDRLGTFAAAARRLNTTQPAISARVRELEGHLGLQLFRREGRVMALTTAGRRLVREFSPIWATLQNTLLGNSGYHEATGVVRIGAGEIAAASCLPGFVSRLKAAMPGVSLEIEIELTANLIQHLIGGQTDIAFAPGAIAHPALKAASIGPVRLVWLASPAIAARIAREGFASGPNALPVWSLSDQSPLYHAMRAAMCEAGIADLAMNFANNARLMIDIVAAGGGIGLFPLPMVEAALRAGDLVLLPDTPEPPPVDFQVAIRAAESDPLVLEIYRQACALTVSPGDRPARPAAPAAAAPSGDSGAPTGPAAGP